MSSRIVDLRMKEVINIRDGCRLGFVNDVEIDVECGQVVAIIVPGRCRFFFFPSGEDYVVPWHAIKKIGEDIILVDCENRSSPRKRERRNLW